MEGDVRVLSSPLAASPLVDGEIHVISNKSGVLSSELFFRRCAVPELLSSASADSRENITAITEFFIFTAENRRRGTGKVIRKDCRASSHSSFCCRP